MLSACQGPQIQRRRELAVHNCLALAPDEPKVISGALDSGRAVGPGAVSESANSELAACGTTTDGQARSEELAARNHGCPLFHACSRITSSAFLSVRSPRKAGC